MQSETRKCQNCKLNFIIEPEDFNFYEKMKVPPPTFCPECRNQRRLAMRNERVFYWRNCHSCGEKIISYYHPEKDQVVWCPKCWWSDKLGPFKYGKNFDFSKSFFEQFKELYKKVPTLSLDVVNCKDSAYVSYCGDDNHCYFDIAGEANEYCYYCKFVKYSRDCLDCSFVYNSELAYECVNCHRVYGSTHLSKCQDCNNCHFLYDCRGCQNCFGCWSLRNKQYHIFNQPYSRDEYIKQLEELKLKSFKSTENVKKKFEEESAQAIIKFASMAKCVNCTGDDQFACKNIKDSFDVTNAENGRWLNDVLDAKECRDLNFSLYKPSFDIELISTLNLGNSGFCNASHYCYDAWYSDKCNNSSDIFGCIALSKQKNCILNKQFSPEEYKVHKERIIEHMKKTGEWGEFFPVGTSGFGYNESVAQEYFPISEKECGRRGLDWWNKTPDTHGKETMKSAEIPDSINEINENFVKEILACTLCGKNFRVVSYELSIYRKIGLPLPRLCPNCRHEKRNIVAGIRRLWHRKCMNVGCPNEFETSYAPDRPEEVYCESCYNKEVY